MIVEVQESVSVRSQTLLDPDAILWTQLVQGLLEGNPIALTHLSTVPLQIGVCGRPRRFRKWLDQGGGSVGGPSSVEVRDSYRYTSPRGATFTTITTSSSSSIS